MCLKPLELLYMKLEDEFQKLSRPEVIQFIEANVSTPVPNLALKGSPFDDIEIDLLINQIVGKNKARKKLPTWFQTKDIVYPPKVNLEQTSSEITADHKSKLVSGEKLIDLTGGFGVDDFYFSKRIKELTYTELNPDLYKMASHNFKVLGLNNIQAYQTDSIEYLKKIEAKFDWIYVDPSRRNENQKVVLLKDSLPNLLDYQELLKNKSKNLLIKTSPMYDIEMGYKELQGIKELHIVSVKNEVKELLWVVDWRPANSRNIRLFNYESQKKYTYQKVNSDFFQNEVISTSECQNYLYEFNASIMKSGFYDHLALKYKLEKLERNTHLYTSSLLINSFPGKIYQIESDDSINFKKLKKDYKGKFVNIISKNMPMSTKAIQKKLSCITGTDCDYLIFTKTLQGYRVLKATKI